MTATPFDDLSDVYESMIDWPKRLAHEAPFYRWLFHRVHAKRILDTACGTGHHAALFHSWGLAVEAADISPRMIERGIHRHGPSDTLRWFVRGFDQSTSAPHSFDVALCLGNSLALAPDRDTLARAIAQMFAAIRPGGAVLIHLLNLWRLPDGPCQWQKCLRATLSGGECLITKGVHRAGQSGYVDLLVTPLNDLPPQLHSDCVRFQGLEADDLAALARQAGATRIELYGSHRLPSPQDGVSAELRAPDVHPGLLTPHSLDPTDPSDPYDRGQSQDLILLAM